MASSISTISTSQSLNGLTRPVERNLYPAKYWYRLPLIHASRPSPSDPTCVRGEEWNRRIARIKLHKINSVHTDTLEHPKFLQSSCVSFRYQSSCAVHAARKSRRYANFVRQNDRRACLTLSLRVSDESTCAFDTRTPVRVCVKWPLSHLKSAASTTTISRARN